MFTGLIQQVEQVIAFGAGRLTIAAQTSADDPWVIGESVAVNGSCLTVVSSEGGLTFDLSPETLARTSLEDLKVGDPVNIERAMKASDRFGGHIVQGHVDTVGLLVAIDNGEFTFQIPPEGDRYLIDKGSITLDGISLTVIEPQEGLFKVAVIPHTLAATNLGSRSPGDRVNVEYDVLAKHVEKLLAL